MRLGNTTKPLRARPGVLLVPSTVVLFFAMLFAAAAPAEVTVEAAVEKTEVVAGEPFDFQIQIEGGENIVPPVFPDLEGCTVQDLGGQTNNSQSINIVNGRMTRVVNRGYYHTFRLTPSKLGQLVIPAIPVQASGRTHYTQPITVVVGQATETDDFKLREVFSKDRCYVGEPVVLTVTWYVGKEARNPAIAVPALQDKRFSIEEVALQPGPGEDSFPVQVNDIQVNAVRGQAVLDGRGYVTLTFKVAMIPKEAGEYEFPGATVSADVLTARRQQRRGGSAPFSDSFFDDFFSLGQRGTYSTVVTPSPPVRLAVLPLPEEGRPEGFSGLVGEYAVSASASPTEVSVGDPITVQIRVQGGEYLKHITLPPLQKQANLDERFKIPEEMAPGQIVEDGKLFTQTFRAKDSTVQEIPPIEVPYFDTRDGIYKIARSNPVPLTVHDTRVLTSQDMEGQAPSVVRSELTARREGIAHNYYGESLLRNQVRDPVMWLRSPVWIAWLILLPCVYLVLLTFTLVRKRLPERAALERKRRAYGDFLRAVKKLPRRETGGEASVHELLLAAIRGYLGRKLDLVPGALTFVDVRPKLEALGVNPELIEKLRVLLDECEAHRYASGQAPSGNGGDAVEHALCVLAAIEKEVAP